MNASGFQQTVLIAPVKKSVNLLGPNTIRKDVLRFSSTSPRKRPGVCDENITPNGTTPVSVGSPEKLSRRGLLRDIQASTQTDMQTKSVADRRITRSRCRTVESERRSLCSSPVVVYSDQLLTAASKSPSSKSRVSLLKNNRPSTGSFSSVTDTGNSFITSESPLDDIRSSSRETLTVSQNDEVCSSRKGTRVVSTSRSLRKNENAVTDMSHPIYSRRKSKSSIRSSPHKNKVDDTPIRSSPRKHKVDDTPIRSSPPPVVETPIRSSPRKHKVDDTPIRSSPPPVVETPIRSSPRKHKVDDTPIRSSIQPASFITPLKGAGPDHLAPSTGASPLLAQLRIAGTDNDKLYRDTKESLHISQTDVVIGRASESATITEFMATGYQSNLGGSMYISGAPGTGKSLCVTSAIRRHPEFQAVYINCMSLSSSHFIYRKLANQLFPKDIIKPNKLKSFLEAKFICYFGKIRLVVIDEMDQLQSRNQEVLYTLFRWAGPSTSKLRLIGVANALDLIDRVLPRLKEAPQLVPFTPYGTQELRDILESRLEGGTVVDKTAVILCARKMSALSGDARKALNVCRRAVEATEMDNQTPQTPTRGDLSPPVTPMTPVTLKVVSRLITDVYGCGSNQLGGQSEDDGIPFQQRLAVCCLLVLTRKLGTKEITLGKLHDSYASICRDRGLPRVDQSSLQSACTSLESRGLLQLKGGRRCEPRLVKVRLRVTDEEELVAALKDRSLIDSIVREGLSGNRG